MFSFSVWTFTVADVWLFRRAVWLIVSVDYRSTLKSLVSCSALSLLFKLIWLYIFFLHLAPIKAKHCHPSRIWLADECTGITWMYMNVLESKHYHMKFKNISRTFQMYSNSDRGSLLYSTARSALAFSFVCHCLTCIVWQRRNYCFGRVHCCWHEPGFHPAVELNSSE